MEFLYFSSIFIILTLTKSNTVNGVKKPNLPKSINPASNDLGALHARKKIRNMAVIKD